MEGTGGTTKSLSRMNAPETMDVDSDQFLTLCADDSLSIIWFERHGERYRVKTVPAATEPKPGARMPYADHE